MDTQQSTLPVNQSQSAPRLPHPECELATQPASRYSPVRVVDVVTVTRLEFPACYIGDVAHCDDVQEEPALLPCIEVQSCREGRYRAAGMVELRIGPHTYLLHSDDLVEAVERTQEAC